jgi:hypothetical protein
MKWNYLTEKRIGEQRKITKFLYLPVSIDGETRWLCKTEILQIIDNNGGGANSCKLHWNNIKFLN